jgi:hypothetical protein
MKCGQTIVHLQFHGIRRMRGLIPLAALFAMLWAPGVLQAKPKINIMLCTPGGGQVPFYLWWSTTGTPNASNYIWISLYDTNGNLLPGYPTEDGTDYVIPASQTTDPPCPLTNPTGSEPDEAPGAVAVALSVSGDWNSASGGPEAVAAAGKVNSFKNIALKVDKTRTLDVRHWEKRLPAGQANKYTVLFEVRNSTKQQAKMRFVYGVFTKSDPERGHIIPVKQRDTRGRLRIFNMLTHAGAPDYLIPANTPRDAPIVVSDLEVDLTKDVKPTDYVYLDVWAIDLTNHEQYPLNRIQVRP